MAMDCVLRILGQRVETGMSVVGADTYDKALERQSLTSCRSSC